MVGVILQNSQLGYLAEANRARITVGPVEPPGSVLADKALALHYLQEIDLLKYPSRGADQRLAHVRPRVNSFFQDQMVNPGLREVGPKHRTCRPRSDDDDLGIQGTLQRDRAS